MNRWQLFVKTIRVYALYWSGRWRGRKMILFGRVGTERFKVVEVRKP